MKIRVDFVPLLLLLLLVMQAVYVRTDDAVTAVNLVAPCRNQ